MDRSYDFSKYVNFKKAYSSHFADTIKIVTMFIKTIFKDSKKFKKNLNCVAKRNLICIF